MSRLCFFVPGVPRSLQRARVGRWGGYTPKVSKDYKERVYLEALLKRPPGWEPIVGPVSFNMIARRLCRKGEEPGFDDVGPDMSNLVKIVEDALEGLAYVNDRQIVRYGVVAKLRVTREPGVSVVVEPEIGFAWAVEASVIGLFQEKHSEEAPPEMLGPRLQPSDDRETPLSP